MRVLVVGGTGLLGQHIVAELRGRGHFVGTLARGVGRGEVSIPADIHRLFEGEWCARLGGFDGVVWATGADDRQVPRAPADRFYHEANVETLRRLLVAAQQVGCHGVVVCGSYFTALDRSHPDLRLAQRHPYVRSRVSQVELALGRAGDRLSAAVLEIPLVFGSVEGRRPLWAPAVPWLRSRWPLVAPLGGTAVVSAVTVGQAAAGALERAAGGRFPVADANLDWRELVARLAIAAGRRQPLTVHRLPAAVLHSALRGNGVRHRLAGREHGFDARAVSGLLTSEMFLDESVCRAELGVTGGDLDRAFHDTVTASLRPTP
jgi:nucleoside-diphosphate-sugar epimerase